MTLRANEMLPPGDLLMVTLDTLRYDAARDAHRAGETPLLSGLMGPEGWEKRHAPGSFTYSSHQAMFAGFLPTPVEPGPHERLFALRFEGSETIGPSTLVLDAASIPEGLAAAGYRTVCIGGVGFFKDQDPLSKVLPGLFQEQHWEPRFGVTEPRSTEHQVQRALEVVDGTPAGQPLFLFLNVSAIHQPNWHHVEGRASGADDLDSHRAALAYVDRCLGPLLEGIRSRAPEGGSLALITSDHGTTYGEDGYRGHRLAHPHVWEVPYMETRIGGAR